MTLQELGQVIREKREAAQLSIDDVAGQIKISSRILKSIEEGSLVGLPHAVYTKSFIRTFGLLVGVDQAELSAHLEELFPPESLDETRNEPGPRTRTLPASSGNSRTIVILLVFLVMVAALAVGGWHVAINYGDMLLDLVKKPFSAISTPVLDSERAEQAGLGRTRSGFTPPPSPDRGTSTSGREGAVQPILNTDDPRLNAGNGQTRPPDGGAQNAPPAPPAPSAPASAGVAASAPPEIEVNQLRLVADQACWISFKADGVKGRDTILQPGQERVLSYNASLEVVFGNAGGVSMAHNGQDIGRAGRPGQRAQVVFPRPAN